MKILKCMQMSASVRHYPESSWVMGKKDPRDWFEKLNLHRSHQMLEGASCVGQVLIRCSTKLLFACLLLKRGVMYLKWGESGWMNEH